MDKDITAYSAVINGDATDIERVHIPRDALGS